VKERGAKVSKQENDNWPYNKLEHWPPLTYRDRSPVTVKELSDFREFLNTENQTDGNKELQPWITFCEGRCTFCYFPVNCDKQTYAIYLDALKKALHQYSETKYVKSTVFTEIYVGGGSPSVLSEEQTADLLDYCSQFNLSKDCVTKFTACTTSLTDKKIRLYATKNITQLDVGVQTFDRNLRKMLMLRDSGEDVCEKLGAVKKNGLGLSIDLLYNLPGQTLEKWEQDLNLAIDLEVESVDCYPLDLYSETPLAKKIASGELPPVGDYKRELQMYLKAYRKLRDNGYFPTCHNRFSRIDEDRKTPASEVIGTGSGFFMGLISSNQYSDIEDLGAYIAAVQKGSFPIARLSKLTSQEEMHQAIMMLYVRVPINRDNFKAKFGVFPEDAYPKAFEELWRKDLITEQNGEIRLSEKGDPWRFNIAWEFFK
jgi:coproporphyrinogen III oxidase-like Fe-S oxidoreductase